MAISSSTRPTTFAVLGVLLIGRAGHWFLTPMRHPNAPLWKGLAVGALFVVGVGMMLYATVVQRRERAEERSLDHPDRTA
jgi:drug/metabolite transporter (DMT)-like permease